MVAIVYVIYAGIIFLNGMQFMGKVKDEVNWPVNLVGGLTGIYLGLEVSNGKVDEPFVMLGMNNYSFAASILCVYGMCFLMFALPTIGYHLGPRLIPSSGGRAKPFDATAYFSIFTGIFTLASVRGVFVKIDCTTMGINYIFIGLLFILFGLAMLKDWPRQKYVGKFAIFVSIFCLMVPGVLMLAFDTVLP